MLEAEVPSPSLSILQEPEGGAEVVNETGIENDFRYSQTCLEIDENLRNAIGYLAGNYPCVHDKTHGNLFVGSQEVVFVGFIFFFEKRVEIQWTNVRQVVKSEKAGGGSCISFLMRTSGQQYDFTNVANSERVWATLISLHNDALHKAPNNAPLITPRRLSLRRMSTDPLSERARIEDGPTGVEAAYVAAATIANMDDLRFISPTNVAAYSVARRQSLMRSSQKFHLEDGVEITADLEEAWRELQQGGGKPSYATSAIQDLILQCDLQTFFHSFIADSASYSFKEYMEEKGETNVIVSRWKKEENDDTFTRTIEYSHPVNAPLAPPMARARREQRYRFYGKHGLSVETDTYVEDVPMADCFYVTERVLVEPANEKRLVVILAEFDIRFVKSTMFRSIIANTTRSECLKGIQGYGIYWTKALATPETPEEAVAQRRSSIEAVERRRSSIKSTQVETLLVETREKTRVARVLTSTSSILLLLGIVLLMQSWMMLELKGMRSALLEVQTSVETLLSKETCVSD